MPNRLEDGWSTFIEESAQRNWLGEDKIWLIPGLKEVKRWSSQVEIFTYRECAIPSETFNAVTIVNVSKQRAMYPPVENAILEGLGGKLPKNSLNL